MSIPFVIIDGYNLLHAAGLARLKYGPGDLERARHKMLAMLCEKLASPEQLRTTVVFDAHDAPLGVAREARHQGLRVLFAPPGSDADSVIEELVGSHPAARQLLVISGDHRLHKAAKRRGATPIDSEPFWTRLRQRPDATTPLTPPQPEKPVAKKATSTDAWLAEFGAIDVDSLAAEVQAEGKVVRRDPWLDNLTDLEKTLADDAALERWLQNPPTARE